MKQNIAKLRERLADIYPKGEIDAMVRIIFEKLLGYSRVDMELRADEVLPDFISEKIDDIIEHLRHHEPIQYILDEAYFYGMHLHVNPATLIPRPETEQLIDLIIGRHSDTPDLRVLDIGTGSGCIAIALARSLKFASVDATDISQAALYTARRNAEELKARVNFKCQDILEAANSNDISANCYDIIVSNPPYIAEHESKAMDSNVLDYEPHTALFVPDTDPLKFYSAITRYATQALKPGGRLYFEINPLFADEMVAMLRNNGFTGVTIELDYLGRKRFTTATLSPL